LSRERVTLSLPPAGKLAAFGGALLLVSMVVLLVAQLAILADSREHIVAQDRKINRIVKGTDPVLNEVEPVADDARALLGQATPFVRDLRATMIPLLRELDGAELRAAVDVTARLATALDEDGRLVEFVDLGSDLVRGLRDSEFIPRTLRAADLVPVMKEILAETLEVQRSTLATQRRTLGTQRETLDIQKQTLAVLTRSLAVQEEALVHVRSIDRKTGGPAPEPTAAVPAPPR
jgi:hypothetical protein